VAGLRPQDSAFVGLSNFPSFDWNRTGKERTKVYGQPRSLILTYPIGRSPHEDPATFLIRHNGEPALVLAVVRRRDRVPTITVQSDIDERLQPPQVSAEIEAALKPIVAALPAGYHIETGGNIEDSAKANVALAQIFPIMLVLTLLVLVIQVRSLSAMFMVFLTAPIGLVGVVPILLIFHQPFGFTAILGLLGLSGTNSVNRGHREEEVRGNYRIQQPNSDTHY
jgi:hypothetical protein